MAEEGSSLMLKALLEHCPKMRAVEAARSRAEFAIRSAQSPLQVVCEYEASSGKTRLEEQCELKAPHDGHTRD